MALIAAGNGSAAQPHYPMAMIGRFQRVRLVMLDWLSWINIAGKMTASRMPLSPWA